MTKIRLSANLGFLWGEQALPEAIHAAAAAGFEAVELHWPYDEDPKAIRQALRETGLPVLALNTRRGDVTKGENGLSALPERRAEARAAIDQALEWAEMIGAPMIHVMAGKASGPEAMACFAENLTYASAKAAPLGKMILIEPLNPFDAPDYALSRVEDAAALIKALGAENLRLMFDCYHLARLGYDVLDSYVQQASIIGHVQFASLPERNEPDQGTLDLATLLYDLSKAGYSGYFGAEYKPKQASTEAGLMWMTKFRAQWKHLQDLGARIE